MKKSIKILALCIFVVVFSMQSFAQNNKEKDKGKSIYTVEEFKNMCMGPVDSIEMKKVLAKQDSMYKDYRSKRGLSKSAAILTVPNWRWAMSDVEDQGDCHNCWVHAATGITEGQLSILYGSKLNVDLDELEIVGACEGNGNWPTVAEDYIKTYKMGSETEVGGFPNLQGVKWSISSYREISGGKDSIKKALLNGPVAVGFYVYEDFITFFNNPANKTGVYISDENSIPTGYKHAVVIVSYDDAGQYWLCKNSAGWAWADSGYFRIGYWQCGIEYIQNSVVTVSQSSYAKIVPNLISSLNTAFSYGLVNNECAHVIGNTTLSGNISVTSSHTLYMRYPATVNLDGYNITASMGEISLDWSNEVIPNASLLSASDGNVVGIYPTIQAALSAAVSGQFVYVISSQSLTSNTTVPSGVPLVLYDDANLTVNSGVTLTINPGAVIQFSSGTNLTVNGVLNANGTSSSRITFTSVSGTTAGSWGSIILSGANASSSTLNYLTMQYGTDIQFLNGANVTLQNSKLQYNTRGVYIYSSEANIVNDSIYQVQQRGIDIAATGFYPTIGDNVITKTSSNSLYRNYEGICISYQTYGWVYHNDIKGFYNGMYIGGGPVVNFSGGNYQSYRPNNRMRDCLYGLMVGWGSSVYMEEDSKNNSIFNNVYDDLYADHSSWISDYCNYYGGGNPIKYSDGTSTIFSSCLLTSDPWGGSPRIASESNGINSQQILLKQSAAMNTASAQPLANQSSGQTNYADDEREFAKGREFEKQKDYTNAIEHFKQMVASNKMANRALAELARIGSQTENSGVTAYFESLKDIKTQYQACAMQLLSGMYRRQGLNEKSVAIYDEIINKFPNTRDERIAWFQKFYYALHVENDKGKATSLLDKITAKYSEDDEVGEIAFAKSRLNPSSTIVIGSGGKDKKETTATKEVPTECKLESYPNPFNPTTVLSYQLTVNSNVRLSIFDILGREVAVLQDGMKEAGKYSATFDASKLSSGVYFSRLTVNPQEGKPIVLTKKMLLMK